jgi:5-(carboxyamino)imidazole ribonucleotide synthase
LKTRRFGYDGKGQVRLHTIDDALGAIEALAGAPAVLEGFVDFDLEISVIAARSTSGQVETFDPGHNVHVDGILRTTTVPAPVDDQVLLDATTAAGTILDALDYVGVLGVELFVAPDGLVVNEIAPRVHNSGHWTQDGCAVDQFEQHIRAIAGWTLGAPIRQNDVVMENLIGDEIDAIAAEAQDPNVAVHAYGKAESKPGRKMGHLNRITERT